MTLEDTNDEEINFVVYKVSGQRGCRYYFKGEGKDEVQISEFEYYTIIQRKAMVFDKQNDLLKTRKLTK
jgi:predicted secreted protein